MRYYGGKTKLLDFISEAVAQTGINHGSVFCDLFSGTTAVAKHFKKAGYIVYANDFLKFSYVLAHAYIQNNHYPGFRGLRTTVPELNGSEENITKVITFLNQVKPKRGFIYKNYCQN
jgi:adenine-specific DNA methylase